jgi:hypothetical protein
VLVGGTGVAAAAAPVIVGGTAPAGAPSSFVFRPGVSTVVGGTPR